MSVVEIPIEILVMILRNLKGTEAAVCRAVCRRWRDAVDSFTDDVWQHFCFRDFWNTKRAKDVSNLSYRDLYKSLSLWSKVGEAEESCPTTPINNVLKFKVLNNNTVAVWIHDRNVIEYYNIQTKTLVSRKTFNFRFRKYDENQKLLALLDSDRHIHVIIKSNDNDFVVDQNCTDIIYNDYALMDTGACFTYMTKYMRKLCVSQLKVGKDGEETIETEELDDFNELVLACARASDGGLNILTHEWDIYCYRNNFEHCARLSGRLPSLIHELSLYGFHLSDENVYRWLSLKYVEEINFAPQIVGLNSAAIPAYNHVVLLGASRRSVHVYKKPYNKNNELELNLSGPERIIEIDITKYTDVYSLSGDIRELDVVETLNGHRLLVLCSLKLFCIDLIHK